MVTKFTVTSRKYEFNQYNGSVIVMNAHATKLCNLKNGERLSTDFCRLFLLFFYFGV